MTACTDDERREVAERLRSFVTDDSVYADVDAVCVLHAIGLYYKDVDRLWFSGFDVTRLADLIDPDSHPNSHPNCGTEEVGASQVPKCDRDALLALADEMQGYADGAASGDGFPYVNAGSLWSYADRIREACGEVVG